MIYIGHVTLIQLKKVLLEVDNLWLFLSGLKILFQFIEVDLLLVISMHGELVYLSSTHKVDFVSHIMNGLQERLQCLFNVVLFRRSLGRLQV